MTAPRIFAPKTYTQRSGFIASLMSLAALLLEGFAGWLPAVAALVPEPWSGLVIALIITAQQMIATWVVTLRHKSVDSDEVERVVQKIPAVQMATARVEADLTKAGK